MAMDEKYYDLQNRIDANFEQQSGLNAEIEEADEKIRRLRKARDKIDETKDIVQIKRAMLQNMDYCLYGKWTGDTAEKFTEYCSKGELFRSYNHYYHVLGGIQDKIDEAIQSLQTEKNEKQGMINDLVNNRIMLQRELQYHK